MQNDTDWREIVQTMTDFFPAWPSPLIILSRQLLEWKKHERYFPYFLSAQMNRSWRVDVRTNTHLQCSIQLRKVRIPIGIYTWYTSSLYTSTPKSKKNVWNKKCSLDIAIIRYSITPVSSLGIKWCLVTFKVDIS